MARWACVDRPISFDRVAREYDATRGLPPEVATVGVAGLSARLAGDRLLEVGVGTGRWAVPLRQAGVPVFGVDVGREMLRVGVSRGFSEVARADATRLPFRDGAFPQVSSHHRLHLIRDWRTALTEIARVGWQSYLSLLERGAERPDLSAEYAARAEAAGHPVGAPGLSERELAQRLDPDRLTVLGEWDWTRTAEEQLRPIQRRLFRDTWATPEPLHQRIVADLRRQHGGSTVQIALRLELAEWSTRRLGRFAREGADLR